MIALENINKSFGGLPVLKNLSFTFQRNKKYAIVGPNNCGKSTLLYLISGFYNYDSGNIIWADGKTSNINKLSVFQRAHIGIGVSFQDPRAFNDFTVEQNLYLSLIEFNSDNFFKTGKEKINLSNHKDKLDELLFITNLEKYKGLKVSALSYGKRKVLDTICLFARNYKFIMLDEPFAGIDPHEIDTIHKLILELFKNNVTLLIVSHEISIICDIVDEIVLMDEHGNIVLNDTPEEVINSDIFNEIYTL